MAENYVANTPENLITQQEAAQARDEALGASAEALDLVTVVANKTVAVGAAAAASAVVSADAEFVVLQSDQDCYFALGDDPTATTADTPLTAYQRSERLEVEGGVTKVSTIRKTTTNGTLYITEYRRS